MPSAAHPLAISLRRAPAAPATGAAHPHLIGLRARPATDAAAPGAAHPYLVGLRRAPSVQSPVGAAHPRLISLRRSSAQAPPSTPAGAAHPRLASLRRRATTAPTALSGAAHPYLIGLRRAPAQVVVIPGAAHPFLMGLRKVPVILPVDLLAALKVFIEADAELTTALPGGYWLGIAPPLTTAPYMTATELDKRPVLQTGRRGGWAAERYQFSVFAHTPTEARTVGNLVRSKFDYLELFFQYGVMSDGLIPDGRPGMIRDPMRGRGNRVLWQEYSTYRAHVNRPGR